MLDSLARVPHFKIINQSVRDTFWACIRIKWNERRMWKKTSSGSEALNSSISFTRNLLWYLQLVTFSIFGRLFLCHSVVIQASLCYIYFFWALKHRRFLKSWAWVFTVARSQRVLLHVYFKSFHPTFFCTHKRSCCIIGICAQMNIGCFVRKVKLVELKLFRIFDTLD